MSLVQLKKEKNPIKKEKYVHEKEVQNDKVNKLEELVQNLVKKMKY